MSIAAHPRLGVPYHFRSDVDGDRHLVIDDPAVDCSEWRVEVWSQQASGGPRRTRGFHRETVWGEGGSGNFLGIGEPREAWVALVDHLEHGEVVLPDGARRSLFGR